MSSTRQLPAFILLACLGALASALTAQYGFGLRPCVLCLYQRVPYALAGLLAAIALLPAVPLRGRAVLAGLCACAFLINSGIAVFHVGVENHWWAGLAACSGGGPQAQTVADLKAMLAGPPPPRCDQIPWALFGISMAGYNVFASLALALFAGWAATRLKRAA